MEHTNCEDAEHDYSMEVSGAMVEKVQKDNSGDVGLLRSSMCLRLRFSN